MGPVPGQRAIGRLPREMVDKILGYLDIEQQLGWMKAHKEIWITMKSPNPQTETTYNVSWKRGFSNGATNSLLHLSSFHDMGTDILYGKNTFRGTSRDLAQFVRQIGPRNAGKLRTLHIIQRGRTFDFLDVKRLLTLSDIASSLESIAITYWDSSTTPTNRSACDWDQVFRELRKEGLHLIKGYDTTLVDSYTKFTLLIKGTVRAFGREMIFNTPPMEGDHINGKSGNQKDHHWWSI